MQKKTTRLVSLLLALSMALSMGLSAAAAEEEAGDNLTVSFVTDGHATVDLYYSKDNYDKADETGVTSAYVRAKGSTEIDNSGEGQVNFRVNADEGYTNTVSVSPADGYNNCKGEEETGAANVWRITKISADLTVTITTSAIEEGTVQTEINDDTLWAYLDDGTDPAGDSGDSEYVRTSWTAVDYDDSDWTTSAGPFGAKNGEVASLGGGYDSYTLLTQYKEDGSTDIEAYFFRTTVTIEDASAVTAIVGQVVYDDAATVYINGTKVTGFDDESITANLEYGGTNSGTPKTGDIRLTDSSILNLLQDGENVIAVEIHQGRSSSSDIYFDMDLTFSQEEATAEQTGVNIAVGGDETGRNFTWYANVDGTGTLYLARESELVDGEMPTGAAVYSTVGTASSTKSGYYFYQISVTGLASGVTYAYRLVNGETESEIYTFTTGADDGSFSFALVGDPQIGAGSTASDIEGWEDTLAYISENLTGAEFILSVGDQVNTANNETEYSGFLSAALSSMTLATVIGNHDSNSAAYSEHFNITNASAYGATSAGTDYYFVYENVLFLVINSNNSSAAEHQAFMKQAIEEAEAEYDIDWKVVTFHHSVYSVASHATEDSILSLRNSLVPIFTELDIDVVLMGHDHVYCRTYMMDGLEVMDDASIYDDESYSSITDPSGILYVTVNSASGSKYYNIQENVDFEYAAVMNQDKERNVSQVTVTETSFTITTYAIENGTEVVDPFTINRTAESEEEPHDAAGHTAGEAVQENVVEATCTTGGSYDVVTRCEDCDAILSSYTIAVAATGHTWDAGTVTTAATCTTDGETTYTCTVCGATYTEAIPATGHTAGESAKENVVAATCTTDGSYDVVTRCEDCNAILSSYTIAVAATGHTWDKGVETLAATRNTEGETLYTCTVCGATKTETIAVLTGSDAEFLLDDVTVSSAYYYAAVYWAYDLGITYGTSTSTRTTVFSPNDDCKREQFAAFIYRLAEAYGYDMTLDSTANPFSDLSESSYAYDAILWCYQEGILVGTTAPTVGSDGTVTKQGVFGYGQDIKRQDAILILYNWLGNGEKVEMDNPFSDLSESSYAYDAVLWAYSVGVTAGTAAPTVDEDGNVTTQGILNGTGTCKRAQMVTFLYRYEVEPLS